jgi:Ca2+-binding RTX toxin-like protein
MTGKIFIESKPVQFGWEHLYLVYQDESGNEFVIRGGPLNDDANDFGPIVVEVGVPIAQSEDVRVDDEGNPLTPGQRNSRELDLGDRDAADVWSIMLQQAQNIDNAAIPYSLGYESTNSNSVISSVLQSIGLIPYFNLPIGKGNIDFPGISNFLDVESTLVGTDGNDIIDGGSNNDALTDGLGNDTLTGGEGYDTFIITPEASAADRIIDFVHSRMDWDGTILEPGDMLDLSAFTNITSIQDLIDLNEGLYGIDVVDEENHIAVTHWNLGNGQTLDFQAIGEWDEFLQDYSYRVYTPQERSIIFYDGEASGGGQDISGTSADDTLLAVSGYDTATGGLGADTFVWTVEAGATGTITDFSSSEGDKIDLAAFTGIEAFDDLVITGGGDTPSISEEPPVAASTLMIAEELPEEPAPSNGDPGNGSEQYALIELGDGQVLRLEGVDYTQLTADDFIFYVDDSEPVEGVALSGGNGKDTLDGGAGEDSLTGGNGKDELYGAAGDDVLQGNNGNDALYAGDGNDILEGGNGNDLLYGGTGIDILTGGNGSDIFVFSSLDHSTSGAADTITDFGKGNDHIDLTGLGFTGIQAGAANGDVLGYTVIDGNTVIEADNSDFSFLLTGDDITLTNDDFVF